MSEQIRQPSPFPRMALARPPRYGCGLGCAVFVGFPFLVGTATLAILNLMAREAMIASSLWLLLVGTVIWGFVSEEGPRLFLIKFLGGFSYRQFVELKPSDSGEPSLCFGYEMFGRSFYELRIPCQDVWSVNWRTGQASARAGEDLDDWHVAIWFRDEQAAYGGHGLHLVGYEGAKEPIEKFGNRFVKFLQQGGIELLWDEKEREYATPNAPASKSDHQP